MARRPAAYQILIVLADTEPPVWRRLIVSSEMTLHELHRTIQLLYSWNDYHLYEFKFGDRRFEAPDPEMEGEDSSRIRLADLQLTKGAQIQYVYDFGDEWLHVIDIERMRVRSQGVVLPWLEDGEGCGPPEDCGGPLAYAELLAMFRVPLEDLPEEAQEKVRWAGLNFDPDEFSIEQARHALALVSAWGGLSAKPNPRS